MALAAALWEAGIRAELVHAAAPSQTAQYEYAGRARHPLAGHHPRGHLRGHRHRAGGAASPSPGQRSSYVHIFLPVGCAYSA